MAAVAGGGGDAHAVVVDPHPLAGIGLRLALDELVGRIVPQLGCGHPGCRARDRRDRCGPSAPRGRRRCARAPPSSAACCGSQPAAMSSRRFSSAMSSQSPRPSRIGPVFDDVIMVLVRLGDDGGVDVVIDGDQLAQIVLGQRLRPRRSCRSARQAACSRLQKSAAPTGMVVGPVIGAKAGLPRSTLEAAKAGAPQHDERDDGAAEPDRDRVGHS